MKTGEESKKLAQEVERSMEWLMMQRKEAERKKGMGGRMRMVWSRRNGKIYNKEIRREVVEKKREMRWSDKMTEKWAKEEKGWIIPDSTIYGWNQHL